MPSIVALAAAWDPVFAFNFKRAFFKTLLNSAFGHTQYACYLLHEEPVLYQAQCLKFSRRSSF